MQVVYWGGDPQEALTGGKGCEMEKGRKSILGMLMRKLMMWAMRTQSRQGSLKDWVELALLKMGKEIGVLAPKSYPSSVECFSPED